MHDKFLARDTPDPADPDVQFGLAPEQITTELIELREEFLRPAGPTVHTELREIPTENGYRPCGLGWFLHALGFTHPFESNRPGQ